MPQLQPQLCSHDLVSTRATVLHQPEQDGAAVSSELVIWWLCLGQKLP